MVNKTVSAVINRPSPYSGRVLVSVGNVIFKKVFRAEKGKVTIGCLWWFVVNDGVTIDNMLA